MTRHRCLRIPATEAVANTVSTECLVIRETCSEVWELRNCLRGLEALGMARILIHLDTATDGFREAESKNGFEETSLVRMKAGANEL